IDRVPYKEISQMLNISVATINYHVGFAMDSLKKKLLRLKSPPD
ncbi:MAG: winged helix-turn-helix transcriptional regulator, partial [Muribaculaceae bacterium]|nr:winged helix-turn-helix transcriptional regulator [Muribaculaceae bacterium]